MVLYSILVNISSTCTLENNMYYTFADSFIINYVMVFFRLPVSLLSLCLALLAIAEMGLGSDISRFDCGIVYFSL